MSSMLYGLGRWAVRARSAVLGGWLVALLVAGIGGAGLLRTGPDDTFTLPGQSSQQALDRLKHVFPELGGATAQVLVTVPQGATVRTADVRSAVARATHRAERVDQVEIVLDPFAASSTNAVSTDGRAAMMEIFFSVDRLQLRQGTLDEVSALGAELQRTLGATASVHVGGEAFGKIVPRLGATEGVGLIVAFAVLLVTFGSFVAAGVPVLTALIGVGVTYLSIYAAMRWTSIPSTAPMIAVMVGLAVGIDYALFIVSRHRDQLRDGLDVPESAARATATAGSAVVFAGATVFIAFAGLSVAGIPFLTRIGLAGAFAVLVAVLVAVTALPALLGVVGERMRPRPRRPRRWRWWPRRRGAGTPPRAGGGARPARSARRPRLVHAWVSAVTRFPWLTIAVVITGLAVCTLPAVNLRLALPTNGSEERGTPNRITYELVEGHFGPGYNAPLLVMLDSLATNDPVGVTTKVAAEIERVPGVVAVPLATPNRQGDTSVIKVVPDSSGDSVATADLVERLRELVPHIRAVYGVDGWVTGFTALTIDISHVLGGALLPFLGIVIGLSMVLLAMVFRSVAIPLKASVGYLLSLGSAFGATTFVFVEGHGADLLGVQQTGNVISFLPIVLMGVLFGLAMDYEVFLVSRMREAYVHGADARTAIRAGFAGAARVVVSAALIMIGVFAAFVPEGSATVKPIAFALAVGVFVDAFLVRMTLVPAVMALLGDRAWRLPAWLDRWLPGFDVEGAALDREVRLRGWPEPGAFDVVAARGLTVFAEDGRPAVRGLSLRVQPGRVLVVEGNRPCGKSALLLALGGHAATIQGDLKVTGRLLPQRNRRVRRCTALVQAGAGRDVAGALRRAVADGVRLVFVDDLDRPLAAEQRRAVNALLSEVVARAPSGPGVVITCHDRSSLDDLLDGIPVDVLPLAPKGILEVCS